MLGIKNAVTITVWGTDVHFLIQSLFSLVSFAALSFCYVFFLYWLYTLNFQGGGTGFFIFLASVMSLSSKTLA